MKPEKQPKIPQEDLFRMRLENMLDIKHELIKLPKHIDWESPDKEWGALFVSTKGAPAIRTRLIAGLHYLKHLHDLSDEQVVKGWTEIRTGSISVVKNTFSIRCPYTLRP